VGRREDWESLGIEAVLGTEAYVVVKHGWDGMGCGFGGLWSAIGSG